MFLSISSSIVGFTLQTLSFVHLAIPPLQIKIAEVTRGPLGEWGNVGPCTLENDRHQRGGWKYDVVPSRPEKEGNLEWTTESVKSDDVFYGIWSTEY